MKPLVESNTQVFELPPFTISQQLGRVDKPLKFWLKPVVNAEQGVVKLLAEDQSLVPPAVH